MLARASTRARWQQLMFIIMVIYPQRVLFSPFFANYHAADHLCETIMRSHLSDYNYEFLYYRKTLLARPGVLNQKSSKNNSINAKILKIVHLYGVLY